MPRDLKNAVAADLVPQRKWRRASIEPILRVQRPAPATFVIAGMPEQDEAQQDHLIVCRWLDTTTRLTYRERMDTVLEKPHRSTTGQERLRKEGPRAFLENGDHLGASEFLRRYEGMPQVKKAAPRKT